MLNKKGNEYGVGDEYGESYSSHKSVFNFVKIKRKLNLYEFARRGTRMYIPDLFCV
jgi:hypothetical protein